MGLCDFKKHSDSLYIVKGGAVRTKVDEILSSITVDSSVYIPEVNDVIGDELLSRIVVDEFINLYKTIASDKLIKIRVIEDSKQTVLTLVSIRGSKKVTKVSYSVVV